MPVLSAQTSDRSKRRWHPARLIITALFFYLIGESYTRSINTKVNTFCSRLLVVTHAFITGKRSLMTISTLFRVEISLTHLRDIRSNRRAEDANKQRLSRAKVMQEKARERERRREHRLIVITTHRNDNFSSKERITLEKSSDSFAY